MRMDAREDSVPDALSMADETYITNHHPDLLQILRSSKRGDPECSEDLQLSRRRH
jgi:hypothetical protein